MELHLKREKVLEEIVETEKKYVQQLAAIVNAYLVPLRERAQATQRPISLDTIGAIFSNIDQIYNVNQSLLAAFETSVQERDAENFGQIMLKYAQFFKAYITYITNYPDMMAALKRSIEKEEFRKFLEFAASDSRGGGLDLPSLLITPVQRIPRYKLLFEQLLKFTLQSDPEYPDIERGLETVAQVASVVNKAALDKELSENLLRIQNRFSNKIQLLQPNRCLLREGQLLKTCPKGLKPYHFFLFNDSFLYAETGLSGELQAQQHIHIVSIQVRDLDPEMVLRAVPHDWDETVPIQNSSFQILSPIESFVVHASSPGAKFDWMMDIERARRVVAKVTQERKGLLKQYLASRVRQESKEPEAVGDQLAPVWMPDQDAPICPLCKGAFSWANRRHHCRTCGTVACKACSSLSHGIILPNEVEPVRMCTTCVSKNDQQAEDEDSGDEGLVRIPIR
eukprot:c20992_g1_i1.p1 GENE.c20992_g1_i1~~c20992_g1_i1.p1  ORF type:complete len:452 (-),score=114.05 c20992_g1_i1:47-1402(-)